MAACKALDLYKIDKNMLMTVFEQVVHLTPKLIWRVLICFGYLLASKKHF